jgi:hypothetical protein
MAKLVSFQHVQGHTVWVNRDHIVCVVEGPRRPDQQRTMTIQMGPTPANRIDVLANPDEAIAKLNAS